MTAYLDQPHHAPYKPAADRLQHAMLTQDNTAYMAALAEIQALKTQQREYLASTQALINAALWYATALGWPVFPLRAGEKTPATRHGFKDATLDPTQIQAWWRENPAYNIGLPTGKSFDVVDIDQPGAYRDHILPLRNQRKFPPILAWADTPRGRHLYIPTAPGRGNTVNLFPGIDYRGKGGYVVAPPSRLATGTQYTWIKPPGGEPYP